MTEYTREQIVEAAASLRVFILATDNTGFATLAEMAGIPAEEIAAIESSMTETREALRDLLAANLQAYWEFQRVMATQRQETPFDPRLYIDPHPLLVALERERARLSQAIAQPRQRYDQCWNRLVGLCEEARYPTGFLAHRYSLIQMSTQDLLQLHGLQ